MKTTHTETIIIEGEPSTVEGFTADEKFLVLTDGTRYRFELLTPSEIDISEERLMEIAQLHYVKSRGWLVNGQSRKEWLRTQKRWRRKLRAGYWKRFAKDWGRRDMIWGWLEDDYDGKEKELVSGVAWFDNPLRGSAGSAILWGSVEASCYFPILLKVFQRRDPITGSHQPAYTIKQVELAERSYLSFRWSQGKAVEVEVPHGALIAWRMLFNNPGKWFSIPKLTQRELIPLQEESEELTDDGRVASRKIAPRLPPKFARMSKSAVEKMLKQIDESKKGLEHNNLDERNNLTAWEKLEQAEELCKIRLTYITKHGDVDRLIPGANTWATWKKRLLDAISKRHQKLGAHLKDSIRTQSGSVQFSSDLLDWVD